MSGTRSNAPAGVLRIITATSLDVKPSSRARTAWSAPRGTFALPGWTSILYGVDASALREMISSAERPWRRYAGPNVISSADAAAQRPHQPVEEEADEHGDGDDAERDDRGRAEPKRLEPRRGEEQREDGAGDDDHRAAQRELQAPAVAHPADDVDELVAAVVH